MKAIKHLMATLLLALWPLLAQAQLSSNPDKFLGNITTGWPGSMNYDGFVYSDYWNQVTPENGTKWGVVEGTRNSYNWTGGDPAYNYAKQKGFPFKFHCLVWGSQYPGWIKNLTPAERYKAIEKWMDTVKKKYPELQLIDVVNEAVEGHQPDSYLFREALGGNGKTGYDWIIKAFEMAHERWPQAILIYNDFNTFQWNTDQFIDLVRTLRDAGAPIDAYGCQSHDLGGVSQQTFKTVMAKIQNALKIPMYITEYDIGDTNDANQKWNFQQHIPVMWEADYCAGVTLWGWFYGHTWIKDNNTGEEGISGLIKDKKERSALTWLRDYMATDKARTAKSPFPGMKKEASLYVAPDSLRLMQGNTTAVRVRAALRTKTIRQVQLYAGSTLLGTKTSAPFDFSYTPTAKGTVTLKAVLTATDGSTYERLSAVDVKTPLGVAQRYTSLAQIGSKPFAIVDEQQQKAIYGKDLQNLGFDGYDTAFDDRVSGYYFKLESLSNSSDAAVRNCYLLRLYRPDGSAYTIWGNPGYLNSQPVDQTCCFILGLNKQNGQDMKNGAVWEIQYVDGKGFTLKNRATGKYLQDATPAKYDTPTYFTFATVGATDGTTGIAAHSALSALQSSSSATYTLDGRRVTGVLRPGIYVRGGRKVIVR